MRQTLRKPLPKPGDTVILVPKSKTNPLYGRKAKVILVQRRRSGLYWDARIELDGCDIGWFNWNEVQYG